MTVLERIFVSAAASVRDDFVTLVRKNDPQGTRDRKRRQKQLEPGVHLYIPFPLGTLEVLSLCLLDLTAYATFADA